MMIMIYEVQGPMKKMEGIEVLEYRRDGIGIIITAEKGIGRKNKTIKGIAPYYV